VNAVASAVNIAAPDSLETQKEIAIVAWVDFLQLIRKSARRSWQGRGGQWKGRVQARGGA
jgi:hypothetical protein